MSSYRTKPLTLVLNCYALTATEGGNLKTIQRIK